MTETPASSPVTATPHADAIPGRPSDLLLEFILGLIAPLLMTGCISDIGLARLAALETIAGYQARGQGELVTIAQLVGFALAALDNLRLSTAEDLSLTMKLRLRGNANALNRASQRALTALQRPRTGHDRLAQGQAEPAARAPEPAPDRTRQTQPTPEVALALEAACSHPAWTHPTGDRQPACPTDDPRAHPRPHDDPPAHTRPAFPRTHTSRDDPPARTSRDDPPARASRDDPPARASAVDPPAHVFSDDRPAAPSQARTIPMPQTNAPAASPDRRHRLSWASAMSDVATEYSGQLAQLAPTQQAAETVRISVLSEAARTLRASGERCEQPIPYKSQLLASTSMRATAPSEMPPSTSTADGTVKTGDPPTVQQT